MEDAVSSILIVTVRAVSLRTCIQKGKKKEIKVAEKTRVSGFRDVEIERFGIELRHFGQRKLLKERTRWLRCILSRVVYI